MQKLKPQGTKIIVQPFVKPVEKTEGGIYAIDFALEQSEIIEIGTEVEHLYKVGDIVLYPEGVGESINYQKKSCKWLDGRGFPVGDIWAIETQD